MSSFTTELEVMATDDGKWLLLSSFEYHLGSLQSKERIIVFPGFKTDFASVPRIFWNIYPPYDKHYGKAAVLHDAMYESKMFKRSKCDGVFKEAMKILGASIVTRNIIYLAVRLGGWTNWKNRTGDWKSVQYFEN
jgi:hypothetical protein